MDIITFVALSTLRILVLSSGSKTPCLSVPLLPAIEYPQKPLLYVRNGYIDTVASTSLLASDAFRLKHGIAIARNALAYLLGISNVNPACLVILSRIHHAVALGWKLARLVSDTPQSYFANPYPMDFICDRVVAVVFPFHVSASVPVNSFNLAALSTHA